MTGLYQLLTDIPVLALAVRCRGRHYKSGSAVFVKIGIEIGYPQIICVAEFLAFVHSRQTKGQTTGTCGGF